MLKLPPTSSFLDWVHTNASDSPSRKGISSSASSFGSTPSSIALYKPILQHFEDGPLQASVSSYTLDDTAAPRTLETLLLQYGTAAHMGARDASYSLFVNETGTGGLIYKVRDKVAMIAGDPLCPTHQYLSVITDFRRFCKTRRWGIAMIAASPSMAHIAKQQGWISTRFGTEKVLNPSTNPLLHGQARSGKRTVAKCRQLLKQGTTVEIYCPAYEDDIAVEQQLVQIYHDWCTARKQERGASQAFMTVFDILSLPRLMAFIYSKDANGTVNGFAALRKLGDGYHIDPFVAAAHAPKGTSDLLLYAAMAFASEAKITKLSLGFEVLPELEDLQGVPKPLVGLIQRAHRRVFDQLRLGGKKTFFERWHPDEEQDTGLYIVYPQRPGVRHMLATMHFANVSVRSMFK